MTLAICLVAMVVSIVSTLVSWRCYVKTRALRRDMYYR